MVVEGDLPAEIRPEHIVEVLVKSYDYEVTSMRDGGVLMTKGRYDLPILIPYGVEVIPALVAGHILTPCCTLANFWQEHLRLA